MEKYPNELVEKMREIYKCIMKRIMGGNGNIEESDVLFIHLFKTEFEQNTNLKE